MDKDCDGTLTKQELKDGLGEIYGTQSAEYKDLGALFEKINSDNSSNGVEYGEFIIAATNWERLMSKQNIDIAFRMFDKNNDGSIS